VGLPNDNSYRIIDPDTFFKGIMAQFVIANKIEV